MKVLITTSGIGSRLGKLTEFTNKSMVKLGKKPAISYIIESYPKDFEFVITLGYYGEHVEQFLKIAYPERKFTFVKVDNYAGPGSSPVYSQLQAKEFLQEPFIYNDCDTILENLQEQIPMNFNYNFLVGFKSNSELYDSFDYDKTSRLPGKYESYKITRINKRTESENSMLSYVGVAGIYDYKKFWECFEDAYKTVDYKILNNIYVYMNYMPFKDLRAVIVDNWTDTGSIQGVAHARKTFTDKLNVLDKTDQAIFIVGEKVIKFFAKDGLVDSLMEHYTKLTKWAPKVIDKTKNFFSYKYIEGNTMITNIDSSIFKDLLEYYDAENLWKPIDDCMGLDFKKCQYDFYIKKTLERVEKLKKMYDIDEDHDIVVNGITIPKEYTVKHMLEMMQELPEYKNSMFTEWHGDFTLENIMKEDSTGNMYLIDWRQNFSDAKLFGDRMYDFAKLNMNLTCNFNSIYNNMFTVIENGNNIHVSILVDSEGYNCKKVVKEFVESKGIRYRYLEIMAGMIWLNMSPLHPDPITKFLYYFGKYAMYTNLIAYNNEFNN